jgi:hypothetical protein
MFDFDFNEKVYTKSVLEGIGRVEKQKDFDANRGNFINENLINTL